jgi:hypothetical protein
LIAFFIVLENELFRVKTEQRAFNCIFIVVHNNPIIEEARGLMDVFLVKNLPSKLIF